MDIFTNVLENEIARRTASAQAVLSRAALDDCNKYCKVDSGALRASSYAASDFSRGTLVWDTPYAREAYYTGNADVDVNPSASVMWAERAAGIHVREWLEIARKSFFIVNS